MLIEWNLLYNNNDFISSAGVKIDPKSAQNEYKNGFNSIAETILFGEHPAEHIVFVREKGTGNMFVFVPAQRRRMRIGQPRNGNTILFGHRGDNTYA